MIIGFIIYSILIGIIAAAAYQKNKQLVQEGASFLVGNRSVNYWLTALSAHASDMSDWLFMAFPAAIYLGGLPNAWIAIGLIIGMWCNWQFVARRLRYVTEEYGVYTLTSFFEKRFNDKSGLLRLISACMTMLFFAVYIAAGLKGIGFLLESTFGIPYSLGILIAIGLVAVYTMLGGFIAVAWIDAFQALFLLAMIVLVPAIAWQSIGGFAAITQAAAQKNISLVLLPDYSFKTLFNIVLMAFSWGVGYMGMPHILTKFMGMKNPADAYKAKYIGITWQITVLAAAVMVGLIGIAFFTHALANPELIFIEMVKQLFTPLLAGFVLCAVAAATLSTIDAQVLVLASVITEDLYKNTFKNILSPQQFVRAYRASIAAIACVAGLISLYKTSTIQELVYYAWMGFGASFGPVVLVALYSSYVNRTGAVVGMLSGGIVAAVWHVTLFGLINAWWHIQVPAVVPGFCMSLLLMYGVTYLTTKK